MIIQGGLSLSKIGQTINFSNIYSFEDEYVANGFLSAILAKHKDFVFQSYLESIYTIQGRFNLIAGGRFTLSEKVIVGATIDYDLSLGIEFGYNFKSVSGNITSAVINFGVPFNEISTYVNPGIGLSLRHQIAASQGFNF